jgi:hypothetical protein
MSVPDPATPPGDAGDHARLRPLFALIVFVEILSIAALYWFGHHFGQP